MLLKGFITLSLGLIVIPPLGCATNDDDTDSSDTNDRGAGTLAVDVGSGLDGYISNGSTRSDGGLNNDASVLSDTEPPCPLPFPVIEPSRQGPT